MPRKQTHNYRKKSFRKRSRGRRVKKDGGGKNRLWKTVRRRNHRRGGYKFTRIENELFNTLDISEQKKLTTIQQHAEVLSFLTETFRKKDFKTQPTQNIINNMANQIMLANNLNTLETRHKASRKASTHYRKAAPPPPTTTIPPPPPPPASPPSQSPPSPPPPPSQSPPPSPPEAQEHIFTIEQLQNNCPRHVDSNKKEDYLSDADFQNNFGMSKDKFKKLPMWQKQEKKKKLKLF